MDVVTFETAKKLKEAGFPQPKPDFGQFWYRKNDYGSELLRVTHPGSLDVPACLEDSSGFYQTMVGEYTYAPTLSDLLSEVLLLFKKQ